MSLKIQSALILLALLLFGIYAVFIQDYDTLTQAQAGYAALIVILGVLPGVVSLLDRREAGLVVLMPLHGLFYSLSFGLPALSDKTFWRVSESGPITDALVLTVLGLICLYLGYYASREFGSRLRPINFLGHVPLNRQISLAWVLYGMYLLLVFVPGLMALPSVGQMYAPLGYVSIGLLFVLGLDGNLPKGQQILLNAAIILTVVIKLLSGSLADPVFLLVFLAILYWDKKRSIPWRFVLIGILIAVLLNPIKGAYRQATWFAESSQSNFEKAVQLYELADAYYSSDDIFSTVGEDTTTVNRLAHISIFSHVISMTPGQVPYWAGESYQTLWTSFIPRVLWPDKPKATIGQDFGHRYDLVGEHDEATSMNLPWLVEFYANFGALGVVGGMFAVGVLFRFLVQKFSASVSRRIEYVLGISLTFSLFYAESNFALMAGGVLLTYLAFFVLLRLLAGTVSKVSAH